MHMQCYIDRHKGAKDRHKGAKGQRHKVFSSFVVLCA
jgi:hypothetical protein